MFRRHLMCVALIASIAMMMLSLPVLASAQELDPVVVVNELQERTFRFFWETANRDNGLIPDRYPTGGASSIAAVGFGLTTYPIGVERGYITREQARERTLVTLRFLDGAPQRADAHGPAGYQGSFHHFLD